ncbi:MAG: EAL domain-containing protein [Kiloniellales bacterium]|nr:EAL domain-containing protein [Kiloniellales bacterium]
MSKNGIQQRYATLLQSYVVTRGETELATLAALGREALLIGLPPEEIAELHTAVLAKLAATTPALLSRDFVDATSPPLIEVLMAYGLAFREEAARREALVEALRSSEELYRQMFHGNKILQLLIDPEDGLIVDANPAAEEYFLCSMADMKGLHLADITADTAEIVEEALSKARMEDYGYFVFRQQLGNGALRDVEVYSSHVVIKGRRRLHWIIHDITDRKRIEAAIHHMAKHDALTNLPNRFLFQERLQEALVSSSRLDRLVAILFLDLDHFKDINDTLGHPIGDLLLKEVAKRLRGCAREIDTVARLSGDEFAVIANHLEQVDSATVLAKRIIDSLAEPFTLDAHQVHSGASIGITIFPSDGTEADHLLKNADLALYRAKGRSRNTYQFYDEQMQAEVQIRKALEFELRQGLEQQQLTVHFQPQINLLTGRVVGAEALVRWHHPVRGLVPPDEFIPLAEETGMITTLGEWVLSTACKQIKLWQSQGLPALQVAVNVSPRQFQQKDFADSVDRILAETGFDSRYLEIELTEGHLAEDVNEAIRILTLLKTNGLCISIDDFGTGYSSLSQLKHMPVDTLKIDRCFIRDMVTDPDDAAIAETIIKLGHSLGLRIIAEGVESEEQIAHLRRNGCDVVQGYFYSKPLPAREFQDWFSNFAAREFEKTG